MSTRPHDNLFRDTFEHPENARGELSHLLGAELGARFDWSTLELVPGTFVDDDLRDSHSDLLFRVLMGETAAYIYLLFEHQSTPEPLFVFRELQYTVRFLTTWLEDHKPAVEGSAGRSPLMKLPVVIPILLYHGPTRWPYATRFEDVLDVDPLTRPLILDFVPKFRLLVDDLSLATDEQLHARAMSELGRVVLWLFKTARSTEALLSGLAGWADLFRAVKAAPNGVAALGKIWHYVMAVHEGSHERVLPALAATLDDEEQRQTMSTIAEQLIEKGKKKGIEEGLEKGIEKGIAEGERATLVRLLEQRFGPLSATARKRIEQAKRANLERWLDRVLTATTLADVLDSAP
jgi:predicted transposase YdaD